jgi:galactokinase
MKKEDIKHEFNRKFNKEPLIISAPGRVNLIGEHTDYNEGFVLPGAIDKRINVAIAPNGSDIVNVFANDFKQSLSFSLDKIEPTKGWENYILGVTYHIQKKGKQIKGVDVWIDGDVPLGGGMSSSAALCSGYGFGLNELFGLGFSRLDLAYIGQITEHTFAGAKVGIMDQFASLHGKKDHLIKLDCRSMEYEYIPFDYPDYKIVMVNSMVKHSLANTEYNVRRQQCEEGVAILKKHYPSVKSLRDISKEQLENHRDEIPEVIYRRCKYVITEKERLLEGCEVLKNHDLRAFGNLMYTTHLGLSTDYEVSCPELDFLANTARQIPEVAGTRMMGGGFGGCTINIVQTPAVDAFSKKMQETYNQEFGTVPEIYITQIENGVSII